MSKPVIQSINQALVFPTGSETVLTCSGTHASSSYQTALNQFVRVVPHNLSVLTGSWFTLVSIYHKILGPVCKENRLAGDKCPQMAKNHCRSGAQSESLTLMSI